MKPVKENTNYSVDVILSEAKNLDWLDTTERPFAPLRVTTGYYNVSSWSSCSSW
jgi:hypothetical protein